MLPKKLNIETFIDKYVRQCENVNSQLYIGIFICNVQLTCETCWAMMMDLLMLNFSFLMCNSVYSELPWHKLWTNQNNKLYKQYNQKYYQWCFKVKLVQYLCPILWTRPHPHPNSMHFLPVQAKMRIPLEYHFFFFFKSDPKWDMKLPWCKCFFPL